MSDSKSSEAFRTISEVSEDVGVPQHVLRFWETKFPAIKPLKRGGNRRYYRPEDVSLVRAVNKLLYTDGYTIRGVQKLIKDRGVKAVMSGDLPAELPQQGAGTAPVPDLLQAMQPPAFGAAEIAKLRMIRDRLAAALQAAQA